MSPVVALSRRRGRIYAAGVLIAQITDCHIVEPGEKLADRVDTATMLVDAVDHILSMDPRPDVVVATGDLVNDGRPAQYERLAAVLEPLPMPVYPIPGNHDDRTGLRVLFGEVLPPGGSDDPVDYAVDEHPVRLVGIDTTIPGKHWGRLETGQLEWLDAELARHPDRPTLIFQHHPPFATGIEWMDRTRVGNGSDQAAVVSGHHNVEMVTCGHLHRVIQARFGGTVAACWPSTGAQLALSLDGTPFLYADEPPVVALHRWDEKTGLASHVSYVGGPEPWLPAWAEGRTPE